MNDSSSIKIDVDAIVNTILDESRYSFERLDYEDDAVWDLISSGKTKGLFQIDKGLGQQWSKKIKPRSVEDTSALVSVIRPGCQDVTMPDMNGNEKTLAEHFVMRRDGKEPIQYLVNQLESIVGQTQGIIVYQEQAIRIAVEIAGFTETEGDLLRVAIGKKKADKMAELKDKFIDGCVKNNVAKEKAEEIFEWISAAQRYSFNKSHSCQYSMITYATAYEKTHNLDKFFKSWLQFSFGKPDAHDEIKQLCSEGRRYGYQPIISNKDYYTEDFDCYDKKIIFGVGNVKKVSKDGIAFLKTLDLKKPWNELLLDLRDMHKTSRESLAYVGFWGEGRKFKLYELGILDKITKPQLKKIREAGIKCFYKALEWLVENATKQQREVWAERLNMAKNPPSEFADETAWIVGTETQQLGIPISCSLLDDVKNFSVNCNCKDFEKPDKNYKKEYFMNVIVDDYFEWKLKKGDNAGRLMARATLLDEYGSITGLAFPDDWETIKHYFFNGATLLVNGFKTKTNDALIIKKVKEI